MDCALALASKSASSSAETARLMAMAAGGAPDNAVLGRTGLLSLQRRRKCSRECSRRRANGGNGERSGVGKAFVLVVGV